MGEKFLRYQMQLRQDKARHKRKGRAGEFPRILTRLKGVCFGETPLASSTLCGEGWRSRPSRRVRHREKIWFGGGVVQGFEWGFVEDTSVSRWVVRRAMNRNEIWSWYATQRGPKGKKKALGMRKRVGQMEGVFSFASDISENWALGSISFVKIHLCSEYA